ncbi:PA-phosphatase related phosphoesterase family protein [Pleurotus pulmonarius]
MAFPRQIRALFGRDPLSWWDRSYFLDWVFVFAIWVLGYLASSIPPFEREFKVHDSTIDHHHHHSQIPGVLNNIIAVFLPLTIVIVFGTFRRSLLDIHHGAIAIMGSRGLTHLLTEFLKNTVGRLRPDFLARCKWDKALKECTGHIENVLDAGQTAAWCFHAPLPPSSWTSSRAGRLSITIAPMIWAVYVAITRLEDYRHHKEDVIVGSLIGISTATIFYLMFWPNPFYASNFQQRSSTEPRLAYTNDTYRDRNGAFELARFEVDESEAV